MQSSAENPRGRWGRRPGEVPGRGLTGSAVLIVLTALSVLVAVPDPAFATSRGWQYLPGTTTPRFGIKATMVTPAAGSSGVLMPNSASWVAIESLTAQKLIPSGTWMGAAALQVGFVRTRTRCLDDDCANCDFRSSTHYFVEWVIKGVYQCDDLGSAGSSASHIFAVRRSASLPTTWSAWIDGVNRFSIDLHFGDVSNPNNDQWESVHAGGEFNGPGLADGTAWACYGVCASGDEPLQTLTSATGSWLPTSGTIAWWNEAPSVVWSHPSSISPSTPWTVWEW